ncbi:MAG: AAA family ATPase [Polyangiaceae bacterium]|nr:AAA family ATPase [Polyangiaceae bacterium]
MRFRRLDLSAYGSFSGVSLDLSGGKSGGLHILYGANEAGKSTALRAITALLFGIPERTADDHTHGTKLMRVGAVLEEPNGRVHTFVRRKKRKDPLRDANDAPVPEAAMEQLLGGLSQGMFESMFGLDHVRLAEGGEALLAGEGDLGESLFEAKLGGEGTRRVLEGLEQEAEALFKPTGKKPLLNVALEEYRAAAKALRDAVQRPDVWEAQQRALDRAEKERSLVEQERRQARATLARLSRIVAALPSVERRAKLQLELQSLGEGKEILAGWFQRGERLDEELRQVERDLERAEQVKARIVGEMSDFSAVSNGGVRALPVALTGEELVVLRNERGRREQLSTEVTLLQKELASLSQLLPFKLEGSVPQNLRLDVEREARLRRLGREASELNQILREAEERNRLAASELAELRSMASAAVAAEDLGPLSAALRALAPKRHLEAELARQRQVVERARAELAVKLAALRPWKGDAAALAEELLPTSDEVNQFAEGFQKAEVERQRIERSSRELASKLSECVRRRDAMRAGFHVPSEAALGEVRAEREVLWRQISGIFASPGDAAASFQELAPEYECKVSEADELGDRLRREAGRVIELANMEAELEALGREREALQAELATWSAQQKILSEGFTTLCQRVSLETISVSALSQWLRNAEVARAAQWAFSGLEQELAACLADYEAARSRIVLALGPFVEAASLEGCTLSECLERAQILVDAHTEAEREERRRLQEVGRGEARLRDAGIRLGEARLKLSGWKKSWEAAIQGLPFSESASVEEVLATLDQLSLVFQKADLLTARASELRDLEARFSSFAAVVQRIIEAEGEEHAELDVFSVADELLKRHRAEELRREKLEGLKVELERAEQECAQFTTERRRLVSELEEIYQAVGAKDKAELRTLEAVELRRQAVKQALTEVESQLLGLGAQHGLRLEELLAETAAITPGNLRVQQEELELSLEEFDRKHLALDREVVSLSAGLALFGATSGAEAAQAVQLKAQEVRALAIRYQELYLAARLLRHEVEAYRVRNQDPLLSRASQLFSRMTLGAYASLRVGLEERVIRCVRSDGQEQEVRALSEGTRFQLYLALRLASIEAYLSTNEPMPLVFDDLLIHFDDERAKATLEILAELSQRTQILFFTHHEHLLHLARRALKPAFRIEHRLSGPSLYGQQELFGQARLS